MPRLVPPLVRKRLALMAHDPESRNWGSTQVHRALCDMFPTESGEPISLRTVEKEWPRLRDTSADWVLRPDDPDPAFTLATLAQMAGIEGGSIVDQDGAGTIEPRMTVTEVSWLRVVHAARPDLSPYAARWLANIYAAGVSLGDKSLSARMNVLLGSGFDERKVLRLAIDLWRGGRDVYPILPSGKTVPRWIGLAEDDSAQDGLPEDGTIMVSMLASRPPRTP